MAVFLRRTFLVAKYCIGCKLDLEGNFSIKKGTYSKGALRTWKNIIDENERWLDETGGDRSKLKMFHNCEFKPISIKSEKENEEIIKTFPPDQRYFGSRE